MRIARERGADYAFLVTSEDDWLAQRLYEAAGVPPYREAKEGRSCWPMRAVVLPTPRALVAFATRKLEGRADPDTVLRRSPPCPSPSNRRGGESHPRPPI